MSLPLYDPYSESSPGVKIKSGQGGVRPNSGRKSLGRSEEDFKYENRPLCLNCNKNKVAITSSDGNLYMRKYCNTCADNKYKKGHRYIIDSKSVCSRCGFKPELDCQLDVDHIDGNHKNDERENLEILCANCHRVKTFMSKDSVNIRFRIKEQKVVLA